MITKAQIKYLCYPKRCSALVCARLNRSFVTPQCIIPEGAIVQLILFRDFEADLVVNGVTISGWFPYDAATLLNPPIIPESKTMKALPAFAVVVLFGLLMYLGASWI